MRARVCTMTRSRSRSRRRADLPACNAQCAAGSAIRSPGHERAQSGDIRRWRPIRAVLPACNARRPYNTTSGTTTRTSGTVHTAATSPQQQLWRHRSLDDAVDGGWGGSTPMVETPKRRKMTPLRVTETVKEQEEVKDEVTMDTWSGLGTGLKWAK